MNKELIQKIRKQIWHHEYVYDGAWGIISLRILKNETKEALKYLNSKNWKIVKILTNEENKLPTECWNNVIQIEWQEGANLE